MFQRERNGSAGKGTCQQSLSESDSWDPPSGKKELVHDLALTSTRAPWHINRTTSTPDKINLILNNKKDRASHYSPGWRRTRCAVRVGLRLMAILLQPSKCLDYRITIPHLIREYFNVYDLPSVSVYTSVHTSV